MIESQITDDGAREKKPFPKLMINGSRTKIVLMTSVDHKTGSGTGTMVFGSHPKGIGATTNSWILGCFEDFDGEIALRNAP